MTTFPSKLPYGRTQRLRAKRNKYGVSPKEARTADGIVFASAAEMRRYQELKMLARAGHISNLELQVPFILVPAYVCPDGTKVRGIKYVADFRYQEIKTGRVIVEDVKGCKTEGYRLKKVLLLWLFPDMDFREVSA